MPQPLKALCLIHGCIVWMGKYLTSVFMCLLKIICLKTFKFILVCVAYNSNRYCILQSHSAALLHNSSNWEIIKLECYSNNPLFIDFWERSSIIILQLSNSKENILAVKAEIQKHKEKLKQPQKLSMVKAHVKKINFLLCSSMTAPSCFWKMEFHMGQI